MQKLFARVFLPFFICFVVVLPARAVALPALAGLNVATGAAGGALTLSALDGVGLVAIGAGVGYLAVDYLTADLQQQLRIPLSTNPARSIPAPAAPASVPQPPQSTVLKGFIYPSYYFNVPAGSTYAEVCALGGGSYNSWAGRCYNGAETCLHSDASCVVGQYGYVGTANIVETPPCPAGYTSSNGSCALSDARTASPDNKCDYSRSGSALAQLTDPDCPSVANNPARIQPDGSIVGGGVAGGQPQRFQVTPLPNGGSHVETATQKQSGSTTVVDLIAFDVSPTGEVVAASSGTSTGSVSLSGDLPTVSVGAAVPPAAGTSSFPSDYARSGEAATAATPIVNALTVTAAAPIPDTEDSDIAQLIQPPNMGNYDANQISGTIPLPFSTDDCTPMVLDMFGRTVSMDLCSFHAAWHPFVNYGTAFMGALMTLRVLFGREEKEA